MIRKNPCAAIAGVCHIRRVRVAALYDVHGNLPTLTAVLADVDALGVEAIVVGGWGAQLHAVHDLEAEALPNRRFPLADIQRLSGGPLFDTAVNFVHFHVYDELAASGVGLGAIRYVEKTSFALVLHAVVEGDDGLRLGVAFDPAGVPRERARAFTAALERHLHDIAATPAPA